MSLSFIERFVVSSNPWVGRSPGPVVHNTRPTWRPLCQSSPAYQLQLTHHSTHSCQLRPQRWAGLAQIVLETHILWKFCVEKKLARWRNVSGGWRWWFSRSSGVHEMIWSGWIFQINDFGLRNGGACRGDGGSGWGLSERGGEGGFACRGGHGTCRGILWTMHR